jgi:hypothetical protein
MPRILIKHLSFLVLILAHLVSSAQSYDADGSLKTAENLLKQNRNYEAREILQKIVSVNSDNPRANVLLGKSYLAENDYANALQYFKVAYTFAEKTNVENYILFAKTAMQNGDYSLAEEIVNNASTKLYISGPDRALIRNIKTSINDVRNGSFKDHVNELAQFANNSSGSELAPYPMAANKFSFSKSTKSEHTLSVESFVSESDKLNAIEVNPALGNITNIQFYNETVFLTICKDGLCNLYSANFTKNYRLKNINKIKELNKQGFSSTQAFVFKLKNTDMILFSSNRPSIAGGFDIYLSYRMKTEWSAPKLLPKTINTPGDEITPFYRGNTLFFSSNYHPNMGGFDIFEASTTTFIDFNKVENLGSPFNSVANDLYFKIYPDGKMGLLSSNRLGSIEGSSATCCNDIYQFPWPPQLIESKKTKAKPVAVDKTEHYSNLIDELKAILPLTLYFHNDIPLPNADVPSYSQTYFPYKRMEKEYLQENYSANNTEFFNNTLPFEYSKLQVFTSLIQEIFKSDLRIEFTIKGYASPLASKRYNDALSQRRINSFTNELFAYKSGIFEGYRENISINQLPFGETKSASGVSDNKQDPKNSVYAFEALRERKIEILDIAIKNEQNEVETRTTEESGAIKNSGARIDSVLVKTESESSYVISDLGYRTDTVIVTNPYSESFTIASIDASCGCTSVEATSNNIEGNGSIKILAKRELFNGSVKPVTLRFISTRPTEQASFVIPLD